MVATTILKNWKIAICKQWFDRASPNLAPWVRDACWFSWPFLTVKNPNFKIPRWWRLTYWKIAMSQKLFGRSPLNLVWWWRSLNLYLYTLPAVKIFKCLKCKMAAAAILKKKSPYVSNGLTDFHEIWQRDARWPSWPFVRLKIWNFENENPTWWHVEMFMAVS